MYYTKLAIGAAILLAQAAAVMAAPAYSSRASNVSITVQPSTATASTVTSPETTMTVAPPAQTPLSLTQQLLIAPAAADRFSLLPEDSQFVFDFNNQPSQTGGPAGHIVLASRSTFPALVGTGSGMGVGHFGPCGMNVLHSHPRASELQIVTEGRLVMAMIPEDAALDPAAASGQRVVTNTVYPYQMTPFYQGSYHLQYNPDCTNATFVAAFSNEDFGRGDAFELAFALANDILGPMFGQVIDGADIDKVRSVVPANIAAGIDACLAKCNIQKRK